MIETLAFGSTGHQSTRVLFGAAALAGMKQDRADQTLELIRKHGINHIDTAADYGASEERLHSFLQSHRREVFLATKTAGRTYDTARASLERSLERMGVDHVDLIQLHNLVRPKDRATALGPGGALQALLAAQEEGLVRHIGITGHGTYVAAAHLESLATYDFASVLCPYNYSMNKAGRYAEDFERLYAYCNEKQVAMQTIKALAQRRWREDDEGPRFSWYRPLSEPEAIARSVRFVLSRPGLFLNSASDARVLEIQLEAAHGEHAAPSEEEMQRDHAEHGIEPLFVRDVADDVRLES